MFGYPKFDKDGVKTLTEYQGPYRDMLMDIRVWALTPGQVTEFLSATEETAILLLGGQAEFVWQGQSAKVCRADVFTAGPWCLHIPKGVAVSVKADSKVQILVQRTQNEREFAAKLYTPDDIPWVDVCRGKFGDVANRHVCTIFDFNTAPYSNMVLGEVRNDRGNWSGYIPHNHPQPEVYYYIFDRPEGFGAAFVGEDVFKIRDGSFSAIPGGLNHPQAVAPGYLMYTCWMIRHFDDAPWNARIDDERYTWLDGAKF